MTKLERLRAAIALLPGKTWDDKVNQCAGLLDRSHSMVYKWLTESPPIPNLTLIALESLANKNSPS